MTMKPIKAQPLSINGMLFTQWTPTWRDRLRVLVSGKLHVQTNTKTDVSVGRSQSWGAVWVEPPFDR